jgi:rhomboid protease GluP
MDTGYPRVSIRVLHPCLLERLNRRGDALFSPPFKKCGRGNYPRSVISIYWARKNQPQNPVFAPSPAGACPRRDQRWIPDCPLRCKRLGKRGIFQNYVIGFDSRGSTFIRDMGLLFNNLTDAEADAYGLVLSASGISYRAAREPDGWDIYVPETAQAEALIAVDQYLRENQPIQRAAGTRLHEYGKTLSGLWASLIVLGFHVVISSSPHRAALVKIYGSAARAILEGELYRAVTSLMIHTNAAHLAGNMVGLALFGTAVCQIAGPGVGWLMILGTGATGNLINAWFYYGRQHLSVGASTAVFGAVGILAGYQFLKRLRRVEGGPAKSWLPLAGAWRFWPFWVPASMPT